MIVDESVTAAFIEAKKNADEKRAVLIARLDELKGLKKSTLAGYNTEMREIRSLLGRSRRKKGAKAATKGSRKKGSAPAEAAETA